MKHIFVNFVKMTGIYVNIPFCRSRCLYCDFYSVASRRADWSRFVTALINEARHKLSILPASGLSDGFTLYFGGGTPSLLPPDRFADLASALDSLLPVHPEEFTIEVNPDDVTAELATLWKDNGVSRISMGVQSLVDAELKTVGRRHDAARAKEAGAILSRFFDNISLDLIFGLPLQSPDSLNYTLEGLLEMGPSHISAYSLTFEERSALSRLKERGVVEETEEDISCSMFELVGRKLAAAGFRQYEISNYALPGKESRHNSLYWDGSPYIGLGPGAHSYDGERRRSYNLPDLKAYVDFWADRSNLTDLFAVPEGVETSELLSDEELCEEMIMTRLRTAEGLDLSEFEKTFGSGRLRRLLEEAGPFLRKGTMLREGTRLRLSDKGFFISDDIISSLF